MGAGGILLASSNIIVRTWLNSSISCIPLYLIVIGLPFIAISSVVNGYFSAVRKAYKSAISQGLELMIKIGVSIFLLQFTNGKGVEYICICLILADVISEVCSCLFLYILYRIDRIKFCKRQVSIITFKRKIFKITIPVSITSYIRSGLSTLKQFIIPNRLTSYGLSYSMALSEYGKINGMTMPVLMFPNVFISSFSGLLIPEFSSLMANEHKKRIIDVCNKIFTITSMFSIYITCIFLCFSNEISLAVFQNIDCGIYFKILAPLILFMYLDNIIDSMLKGLNKQFGVMICNILDLVITIGALYFLLPVWGMSGYLLATFISEIFNFLVSYIQLHKAIGFHLSFSKVIFIPSICAFFTYLFLQFICFYVTNMSFLLMILLFTACFIFFYFVLLCM